MQFIDLGAQQRRIRDRINDRIAAVLEHGKYIMGPEVGELEVALAEFCGARYCISCGNGTDALHLALMAIDARAGDAVFVPSFTFAATAEAVCLVGATPVFVDIDPSTFNMAPDSLVRSIGQAKAVGLVPKAVIPVDLFGQPANYPAIIEIVKGEQLKLICDSAQGWGGEIEGRKTGTFGDMTTTSFFPAKPLGCYGDGGAVFTDDPELAAKIDSLRVHGKGKEKYENVRIGSNSRLDTLQAAILLEKIKIYPEELDARNVIAMRYTKALLDLYQTPNILDGYRSIWAQYTLLASSEVERDKAMSELKAVGIPSMIYYPRPLHTQSAYAGFPVDPEGLQAAEIVAKRAFSLPMHPYLTEENQYEVIAALRVKR